MRSAISLLVTSALLSSIVVNYELVANKLDIFQSSTEKHQVLSAKNPPKSRYRGSGRIRRETISFLELRQNLMMAKGKPARNTPRGGDNRREMRQSHESTIYDVV
ncbi:heterocyst-inhibiting protein PatX [Calothrix sp. 336/3]|uniref:heterocyst-inhibiting protein PatX n=1 Tax=Calothrix sp. 336/3 TaxID=1337936 RepID=UPI0004E312E7|nr:hypothetical protein [Calothrix sp. 336/3]AKG24229.1 hypothetical protein IJ00_25545 [Calothrix sp. 336/3]